MIEILSDPIWQGLGVIVALTGMLLYAWFELRRRRQKDVVPSGRQAVQEHPGPPLETGFLSLEANQRRILHFELSDPVSERAFYDHLIRCIDQANQAIYRTGHGFHHERSIAVYGNLMQAEKNALQRNVEMIRIQTGANVAPSWAAGYAELLDRHGNFKIFGDFESILFNDIGLLDPLGHDPIVYFLFESHEPVSSGIQTRAAFAMFVEDARPIAGMLSRQFIARTRTLKELSPSDVRALSKTYVYFGWGVHMASRRMFRDVPDAEPLGMAALPGWRRDVRAMLAGPADRNTIRRTGNDRDSFDGVAYRLSWWGKTRLDELEGRAYEPVDVVINLKGKPTDAFTYIPLPASRKDQPLSPDSWIDLVIEGAQENRMRRLLNDLTRAGGPIREPTRGAPPTANPIVTDQDSP